MTRSPPAQPDGAPLSLTLLGRFRLAGPLGDIDVGSRKLCALLAFLACTAPEPQGRERLMTLLWGSHFEAQAKQNLRQALSRLRKLLGADVLESDGEAVWLKPSAVVSDVGRFEGLIREGGRAALDEAADLYAGRLIDDVAVSEEVWTEWLSGERERLQELALGAMIGLGEQELVAGRADHALKAGRRAVALNTMREDAHRLIVRALAATGRRAEALKHYQDLVALLRHELNAEPDAATRSLVAALRSRELPGRSAPAEIANTSRDREQEVNAENPGARRDDASSAEAVRSGSSGRRHLTILACNMVGSTALAARLDPEDMRDLIAAFHKAVADTVGRFGGFVAQYLADGALVYFGYPAADEHDAEQAVRASFAILDAVGTLQAAPGVPSRARIGIATGLVVVGERLATGNMGQQIAIGETPDLAARLQAAAAPGEILIAASTLRLVGRMFDCRALDADAVKRLPQAMEAWQVRGVAAGVSRFDARRAGALSPLVGRQEDMELLRRRWDQAKRGEGRVVLLSGEPGIGKSRIVESLLVTLEGAPHVRLRYSCSPHHTHSPLYPFITQLEQGFEPGSDSRAKLDRLESLLKPAATNLPRDAALIAELLDVPAEGRYPALALSPPQKREMTLVALLDQLVGTAAQRPVLIVFEDIHWIDPTSLDLLDRTVARVANLPVLLVITMRPETQPAWVGEPHVTMLPLSRLGRRDSAGMIGGITGNKALPNAVVEQIVSRADGVPLFIEELTSSLLESGALRETADGYELDRLLPALAVPATLQASLVARLDRLVTVKDLAQIGAAIGREFSHELIAAVATLAPNDLDAALERLITSGLISRRGIPPVATYAFKHALVQDAAYETQPKNRRQAVHRSIAEALRERFAEVAVSTPEVVAHHYTQAGLAPDAVVWWRKAGEQALRRAAHVEALRHLDRGRALIPACLDTPERSREELNLEVCRGAVLLMLRGQGAPEVREAYDRAALISRGMPESEEVFLVLFGLWRTQIGYNEMEGARETGVRLLDMAERLGDRALLLGARMALGMALYHLADLEGAWRHVESGVVLQGELGEADRESPVFVIGQHPGLACVLCSSFILLLQGAVDGAFARQRRAIAVAEEIGKPFQIVTATGWSAILHLMSGEPETALRYVEKNAKLLAEQPFPQWQLNGDLTRGAALVRIGRAEEGFALLRSGMAMSEEASFRNVRLRALAFFAQACAETGRVAEGLAAVREAWPELQRNNELWWEPELHRLEGEFLLRDPGAERNEAEACLRRSVASARRMGLKLFEVRAATSLARVLAAERRNDEAREVLAGSLVTLQDGGGHDLLEARRVLALVSPPLS
jgi:class 3 adenylate cyclase